MKHTGRKYAGWLLCAALALAILAGMTSGQAETPKAGDACPYCTYGTWMVMPGDTQGTHMLGCSNGGCEYSISGPNRITEEHYGGRNCTTIAYCEACKQPYSAAPQHDLSPWVYCDSNCHVRFCRREGCGYQESEDHAGGTATCVSGPVCEVCGDEYGRRDDKNHAWGDDWTDIGPLGHVRYCRNGCGEMQAEAHSGGERTCLKGFICTKCDAEYDEPLGHSWTLDIWKDEMGWDWAADGSSATAHLYCAREECDATADVTDSSPAKTDNGTSWTFTATVGKDGETFTGKHTAEKPTLTITAVKQTYEYNGKVQGEGGTAYSDAGEIARRVTVSGLQGGDTLTSVCLDGEGKDVGEYGLTVSGAQVGRDGKANSNYNIQYVSGKLIITGRKATVKADSLTKTEGEKDPELTATVTGALDGDTLDYTLSREPGEAPGKYKIIVVAGSNPNYDVTGKDGTLTITAKSPDPTDPPAPTAGPTAAPAATPEPAPEGHRLEITGTTITRITYRCGDCGETFWRDNPSSRNAIPGLVKDEEDADVDYTAGVTREEDRKILTVTPELEEGDGRGICLRLKPEDAEAWAAEGIDAVRFDRNGTVLEIRLASVPGEWFAQEAEGGKPEYYEFLLRPAEGGTTVEVSALTADGKIPAGTLEGITLKTEGAEIPVTMNGTWPAEDEN